MNEIKNLIEFGKASKLYGGAGESVSKLHEVHRLVRAVLPNLRGANVDFAKILRVLHYVHYQIRHPDAPKWEFNHTIVDTYKINQPRSSAQILADAQRHATQVSEYEQCKKDIAELIVELASYATPNTMSNL